MKALAAFLKRHRELIIERWLAASARLPAHARLATERQRRDNFPELLDALAEAIERGDAAPASLEPVPSLHAEVRWEQEFALREIVAEYGLLRRTVLEVFADTHDDALAAAGVRITSLSVLHENIDRAIAEAVDHYALHRERTSRYLAGILGHDLRDPLNTILLNAQLILRDASRNEDRARSAATRIASSAERMERLISDLLDLTSTRLGHGLPLTRTPQDLRRLAVEVTDDLVRKHPDRRIECPACEAEGNFLGAWDADRIHQALSNLINNAIRHGEDPIRVEAVDEGDHIALVVSNRGAIQPPLRQRLFEPFVSSDHSRGSGLGLYIAREIAHAHAGSLSLLDHTPDRVVFRMQLPRVAEE